MNTTLNFSQIELGNVFIATNHKGEEVVRRLVGGQFGSVTKFFTIDLKGNLKSNARKTKEEVLDGYAIHGVQAFVQKISGYTALELEDVDTFKKDDVILCNVDGELVKRQLVGGRQFETTAYFTIDPVTGKRCSKTTYSNLDEVAEQYDIEMVFRLV